MRIGAFCLIAIVIGATSGCTELAIVGSGGASGATSNVGSSNITGSTANGLATSGMQSGSSVTGASTSTGVMCVPVDCADADPCTIDTCESSGLCTHEMRAPGEAGDIAEGPCEGVCQTDGTCGLAHYQRAFDTPTWTKAALSEVWSGVDAPPPRGIVAADRGTSFELMVAAESGMIHRRVAGTWLTPVSSSALFDIGANQIRAFTSIFLFGQDFLFVFFVDNGVAKQVTFSVDGANVELNTGPNVATNEDLPWATFPLTWSVFVNDAGGTGHAYYRLDNGNVYESADGGYVVTPESMSPFFGDPVTAPTPTSVTAGLANGTVIELIAP